MYGVAMMSCGEAEKIVILLQFADHAPDEVEPLLWVAGLVLLG